MKRLGGTKVDQQLFNGISEGNLQLVCIAIAPLTLVVLLQIPQNIEEAAEELELMI